MKKSKPRNHSLNSIFMSEANEMRIEIRTTIKKRMLFPSY